MWEDNRACSGARREGNGSGIPPHVILNCYPNPWIRVVFCRCLAQAILKSCLHLLSCLLVSCYISTCTHVPLSRNGSQKKWEWGKCFFSWVSVYPDEFNLWPYRRMSAAAGMSYVRLFFFYSPLAILHSICLSQMCCSLICAENRFIGLYWKAGHGNLVGLAPGVGRWLWSSRSAEQQQQDLGELGGEVTMFQVEFVTKENIQYPYSHIVYISDAFVWESWRYSQ